MNERDSEFIKGLFLGKGYRLVDTADKADIVLFNTCSVRKHAEERAISNMGALLRNYNRTPHTARRTPKVFGIVGCTAQALKGELFKRLPGLGLVCGTGEIAQLTELAETCARPGRARVTAVDGVDAPLPELDPPYRESGKHAYVYIMRGCNNFCSYCIVPYVRGRERSRKADSIVDEIKDLVKRGIADITLLGQNVNSYRSQVTGRRSQVLDFAGLLRLINGIEGIEKIRFMTSHPKDASVALFEAMKDCGKMVKHLHLPLQSGSDRILELMNRGYTARAYLDLVTRAREIMPDLRLTTDIMVGFPTEKEKDFRNTVDLVKKIKFDLAYIFKYSTRPGTKASELKEDVPEDVKKERHKTLLDLQKAISKKKKNEKNI